MMAQARVAADGPKLDGRQDKGRIVMSIVQEVDISVPSNAASARRIIHRRLLEVRRLSTVTSWLMLHM